MGVIFGMMVFGEMYPLLESFHKSGSMGTLKLDQWLGISIGIVGFIVILMALGMFWGGEWLEKKFGEKEVA